MSTAQDDWRDHSGPRESELKAAAREYVAGLKSSGMANIEIAAYLMFCLAEVAADGDTTLNTLLILKDGFG